VFLIHKAALGKPLTTSCRIALSYTAAQQKKTRPSAFLERLDHFQRKNGRAADQIPLSGSYRDGTLELRYYQDPGLKVGEQFPLWLIKFRNRENRRRPLHQSIDNLFDSVSLPLLKLFAGPFRVRESVFWLFSRRSRK
jgi:hypothetical protein